ncbi:MAG: Cof-type HAD-IIB family hydrolase [Dorea sp.]|nr:Cof-type HAD-IIB family hydrolase [Dorea sp.]
MNVKKLIAFDLDNTLAALGKGMLDEDLIRLRKLEAAGARIAIVSGKPTYYLCGFMRQVEIEKPVLVGENGAVIQFGVDLPPRDFYVQPYSEDAKRSLKLLHQKIDEALPHLWYQPNMVGLTPFPTTDQEFAIINRIIDENRADLKDILVYQHCDSFDITPCGINKFTGLEELGKLLGIPAEDTIAVGDGVNDYPMFEYAGHSVGVNVAEPDKVDVVFTTAADALDYLIRLVQE